MPSLAEFLVDRLDKMTDHIFGIPGDYVLNLYDQLSRKFDMVGTTDEQCAGFAADAYARVHGFGVVCATYCVGGFKLVNAIAGAYAERSPVLFISGAPGVKERKSDLLLHHAAGPYECQHDVFKKITCASVSLDDPDWACHEIDRVIETMWFNKQPGYIEVPRDMVDRNVKYDVYTKGTPDSDTLGDQENLKEEALEKTIEWLERSKNPVILAGVEVARFGLGQDLIKFAERLNIPVALTMLAKSVINEQHALSLNVYAGCMTSKEVRDRIEQSDCVLMLGVMQTDMNFGFKPLQCHKTNTVSANTGSVRVRRSTYDNVSFQQFVSQLLKLNVGKKAGNYPEKRPKSAFVAINGVKISSSRLFQMIDSILDKNTAIIADIGDSLFGASDLTTQQSNQFLSPAFYTSMGCSIPSALGLQLAMPHLRPIVIIGDGAFQMTGMEFSTIVRRGLNPIVFVLDNGGYGTERYLGFDGEFNDVQPWQYHLIPKIVGGGKGYLVRTEDELASAVQEVLDDKKSASIIQVMVDKMDATPALKRMAASLSERVC